MKKLFYSVSSLHDPHAGVILNKMLSDQKKGVEVVLAYCDRALPSCFINIYGNTGICKVCRHMHRQIIHKYLPDIKVIPISARQFSPNKTAFCYDDILDLKKITYRHVSIGLSLHSYYVTITRKPSGKVTPRHRAYFDQLLSALCSFVDYAYIMGGCMRIVFSMR